MLLRLAFVVFILALPGCARSQTSTNRDPAAARLVFDDLPRFWQAWDLAQQAPDAAGRAAIYQREYLDAGSAGLREFDRLRIEGGAQLAANIAAHPRYYASLRARTDEVRATGPAVRQAMVALARRYPEAVFPDVYFLIGRMNSGGTLSDTGLLIGVDMYGLADDTPRDELGTWHRAVIKPASELAHIVAHELVHYHQRYTDRERAGTLLAISVNEGVADYVAELVSGAHINTHVHAWAAPREAELWREFSERMHGQDTKGWVYDTEPGGGRPADLGYFVGYRIAQCRAARAPDPADALRAMLVIDDFDAFLAASGYDGSPCPAPQ